MGTTVAVWLVADFKALSYQVTTTFDTSCAA
jgi:Flp pilus assembly pilin Flp